MQTEIEKYIPENLNKWELPDSYFGEHWDNYFVFLGRHRDSDLLDESNFEVAYSRLQALEKKLEKEGIEVPENSYQIVRESHFLVGWIEWIAISEDAIEFLKLADKIQDKLENGYCVLDEEHLSRKEMKVANEIWEKNYNVDERIKYIRENESQFDFSDYRDLISVVRGKYFIGYASELIG